MLLRGVSADYFVCAGLIVPAIALCAALTIKHLPKKKLTKQISETIKDNGLVHFTEFQHVDSILENGVEPRPKKSMSVLERNFTWYYYISQKGFNSEMDCIKNRYSYVFKTRKNCDSAIVIKDIPPTAYSRMRTHSERPYLVIHKGILKTPSMRYVDVSGFREEMLLKNE